MDLSATAAHRIIRPWRTATLVASAVAAVELLVLVVVGGYFLAKPISHALRHHAEAAALAPVKKTAPPPAKRAAAAAPAAKLARAETSVIVLNGNGHSGAAANAAARVHALGHVIAATGNARRQDYANTVVMYRPGYRGEGLRLARDLHVPVVGPLDGMKADALMGGQLALIVGS